MVIYIFNKVLFILLFMSVLNILRHSFFLIRAIKTDHATYILDSKELIILGLSLSYVFTCIFIGVTL